MSSSPPWSGVCVIVPFAGDVVVRHLVELIHTGRVRCADGCDYAALVELIDVLQIASVSADDDGGGGDSRNDSADGNVLRTSSVSKDNVDDSDDICDDRDPSAVMSASRPSANSEERPSRNGRNVSVDGDALQIASLSADNGGDDGQDSRSDNGTEDRPLRNAVNNDSVDGNALRTASVSADNVGSDDHPHHNAPVGGGDELRITPLSGNSCGDGRNIFVDDGDDGEHSSRYQPAKDGPYSHDILVKDGTNEILVKDGPNSHEILATDGHSSGEIVPPAVAQVDESDSRNVDRLEPSDCWNSLQQILSTGVEREDNDGDSCRSGRRSVTDGFNNNSNCSRNTCKKQRVISKGGINKFKRKLSKLGVENEDNDGDNCRSRDIAGRRSVRKVNNNNLKCVSMSVDSRDNNDGRRSRNTSKIQQLSKKSFTKPKRAFTIIKRGDNSDDQVRSSTIVTIKSVSVEHRDNSDSLEARNNSKQQSVNKCFNKNMKNHPSVISNHTRKTVPPNVSDDPLSLSSCDRKRDKCDINDQQNNIQSVKKTCNITKATENSGQRRGSIRAKKSPNSEQSQHKQSKVNNGRQSGSTCRRQDTGSNTGTKSGRRARKMVPLVCVESGDKSDKKPVAVVYLHPENAPSPGGSKSGRINDTNSSKNVLLSNDIRSASNTSIEEVSHSGHSNDISISVLQNDLIGFCYSLDMSGGGVDDTIDATEFGEISFHHVDEVQTNGGGRRPLGSGLSIKKDCSIVKKRRRHSLADQDCIIVEVKESKPPLSKVSQTSFNRNTPIRATPVKKQRRLSFGCYVTPKKTANHPAVTKTMSATKTSTLQVPALFPLSERKDESKAVFVAAFDDWTSGEMSYVTPEQAPASEKLGDIKQLQTSGAHFTKQQPISLPASAKTATKSTTIAAEKSPKQQATVSLPASKTKHDDGPMRSPEAIETATDKKRRISSDLRAFRIDRRLKLPDEDANKKRDFGENFDVCNERRTKVTNGRVRKRLVSQNIGSEASNESVNESSNSQSIYPVPCSQNMTVSEVVIEGARKRSVSQSIGSAPRKRAKKTATSARVKCTSDSDSVEFISQHGFKTMTSQTGVDHNGAINQQINNPKFHSLKDNQPVFTQSYHSDSISVETVAQGCANDHLSLLSPKSARQSDHEKSNVQSLKSFLDKSGTSAVENCYQGGGERMVKKPPNSMRKQSNVESLRSFLSSKLDNLGHTLSLSDESEIDLVSDLVTVPAGRDPLGVFIEAVSEEPSRVCHEVEMRNAMTSEENGVEVRNETTNEEIEVLVRELTGRAPLGAPFEVVSDKQNSVCRESVVEVGDEITNEENEVEVTESEHSLEFCVFSDAEANEKDTEVNSVNVFLPLSSEDNDLNEEANVNSSDAFETRAVVTPVPFDEPYCTLAKNLDSTLVEEPDHTAVRKQVSVNGANVGDVMPENCDEVSHVREEHVDIMADNNGEDIVEVKQDSDRTGGEVNMVNETNNSGVDIVELKHDSDTTHEVNIVNETNTSTTVDNYQHFSNSQQPSMPRLNSSFESNDDCVCDSALSGNQYPLQPTTTPNRNPLRQMRFSLFPCTVCSKRFVTSAKLDEHVKHQHDSGKFGCNQCVKSFNSMPNLLQHVNRMHEPTELSCGRCDSVFTTRSQLIEHCRSKHSIRKCSHCQRRFPTVSALQRHMTMHKEPEERPATPPSTVVVPRVIRLDRDRRQCADCGKRFLHESNLKAHRETAHASFGKSPPRFKGYSFSRYK